MVSLSFGSFLGMPIAFAGLVALVSGVLWFFIERKKTGFGKGASVLTIVLMPIVTIPLYIIYMQSLGIFLQAVFDGLALLFAGSGFFAVGLIGIYIEKKPKKLGFSFMILSLLFLIGVPLVNEYRVLATRWFTWIATPYKEYTIPLFLVSIAFFILGCVSIFYERILARRNNLVNTKTIEQDKTKPHLTYDKEEEVIGVRKFCVPSCNVGFICLILGSLSIIGAAVVYAPNGPSPLVWGLMSTSIEECTLPLIILSIALFFLGSTFMLYEKSKKPGFLVGISGSLAIMFAAFVYGYRTLAIGRFDTGEPYFYSIYPFREYTFPIFIVGILLVVFGYTLVFRMRLVGRVKF